MATIDALDMREIGKGITLKLKVTGIRRFRLRFAIALPLLKLFAWIAPVNVEITTDEGHGG